MKYLQGNIKMEFCYEMIEQRTVNKWYQWTPISLTQIVKLENSMQIN